VDGRVSSLQPLVDLLRGEPPLALVPGDHEVRHLVGDLGDARLDGDTLPLPDHILQMLDHRLGRAALGLEVECRVALHGGDQAGDLLLADLHAAPEAGVGREGGPCAVDQVVELERSRGFDHGKDAPGRQNRNPQTR